MDRIKCPKCQHTLHLTEINAACMDCYYVCISCRAIYFDELKDPGIVPALFKGKTSKKDTKEFYETEVIYLQSYIDHLNTTIHGNLSQWACHLNASLSLILRTYLAECTERLERIERTGKERG